MKNNKMVKMIHIRPDFKLSFLSHYMEYYIDLLAAACEFDMEIKATSFQDWIQMKIINGFNISFS